jgi:hypothetical protein
LDTRVMVDPGATRKQIADDKGPSDVY